MDKNKQILGFMSLCRRAGKLVGGFDAVCDQLTKKQYNTVLLTPDLSDRTRRAIEQECQTHRVPIYNLPITMDDISTILHRRVGVLCVTDKNFAMKFQSLLQDETAGESKGGRLTDGE